MLVSSTNVHCVGFMLLTNISEVDGWNLAKMGPFHSLWINS